MRSTCPTRRIFRRSAPSAASKAASSSFSGTGRRLSDGAPQLHQAARSARPTRRDVTSFEGSMVWVRSSVRARARSGSTRRARWRAPPRMGPFPRPHAALCLFPEPVRDNGGNLDRGRFRPNLERRRAMDWMRLRRGLNGAVAAGAMIWAATVVGACSSDPGTTTPPRPMRARIRRSCGAGSQECGGVCTVVGRDPENCGACGTKCATGQVCSQGACALELRRRHHQVRRSLHRHEGRQRQLRRLRHQVRGRAGLFGGRVRGHLRRRAHPVRPALRQRAERPDELRRLRHRVRRRRELQRRQV